MKSNLFFELCRVILVIVLISPIYGLKAQNYEKGQFDYGFSGSQTNLVINYDRSKSEIRSERVKIKIEINKSRKLLIDGKVEFYFGQNPNNLSKSEIGSVTSSDDFNIKTFYFNQRWISA